MRETSAKLYLKQSINAIIVYFFRVSGFNKNNKYVTNLTHAQADEQKPVCPVPIRHQSPPVPPLFMRHVTPGEIIGG